MKNQVVLKVADLRFTFLFTLFVPVLVCDGGLGYSFERQRWLREATLGKVNAKVWAIISTPSGSILAQNLALLHPYTFFAYTKEYRKPRPLDAKKNVTNNYISNFSRDKQKK